MEYRDCESYVLAVLARTENELEETKTELADKTATLQAEVDRLTRAMEILNPHIKKTYSGQYAVDIDFLWSEYHSEEVTSKYNELKELLNLEIPEEDDEA